jgi:hypothetical protein
MQPVSHRCIISPTRKEERRGGVQPEECGLLLEQATEVVAFIPIFFMSPSTEAPTAVVDQLVHHLFFTTLVAGISLHNELFHVWISALGER